MENTSSFSKKGHEESIVLEGGILANICTDDKWSSHFEFIRTLLQAIPVPVFFKDLSGRYIGCNRAFEEFIGKPREEIIGKTVYDIGPSDIAPRYETMDKELFELPGKQTYEWKVRSSDGSERNVIFHKASFKDSSGETAGLIGVIIDITDFKQAIDALRESERDVKAILNASTESVLLIDTSGIVLAANEAVAHRLETDIETLKGKNVYDFISPDIAQRIRKEADKVIEKGEPVHFEGICSGRDMLNSIYPVFNSKKEVEKLVIFGIDITAVRRAEDSLRKREEFYRTTIENALDGYLHIGIDGMIRGVNEAYCKLSGYTRDELLGMQISDLDALESPEQTAARIQKIIRNGSGLFETKHRAKDGSILDMEVSTTYSESAGMDFFCFFRDLTQHKRAEERELHLKNVLLAIRNVNQLIVRENDPRHLIEKACANLTETLGYFNAWIALLDKKGSVTATAASWHDGGFTEMLKQLESGRLPECMISALGSEEIVVLTNPCNNCHDCPLSGNYPKRSGLAYRLQFEGNIYGLMAVSIPYYFAHDKEEQELFTEIANDLGFAIHKINAAKALIESEQNYRTLADTGQALIWTSGTDKLCNYFNLPWLQFTGRSLEQELGNGWLEGVHPDDMDHCERIYTDAFDKHERFTMEYRLLRHDGEYRWILDDGSPRYDSTGKFIGYIGHCLDITERKKAENKLAEEAIRHRILIEQSSDGIVVLDENGKVYEANRHYADMLGYSPEEVIQLHVWDWDTQWTREELLDIVRKTEESGDHFETLQRRKDGTLLDVEISTNGAICNGEKLVFCVCRDISERKCMEEELRKSEEKYRELVQNANSIILKWNRRGEVLFLNEFGQQFFGYSEEEIIGKTVMDTIVPEHEASGRNLSSLMDEIFEHPEEHARNINENICKDGRRVWISWSNNPIYDSEGLVIGMFSVGTDITVQKRAEEALQESEEKHRRLFETMNQGIVYQDQDGAIISANPAAERILGLSLDQMRGRTSMNPAWKTIYEDGSDLSGRDHPAMVALRTGRKIDSFIMGVFQPEKNAHSWLSVSAIPLFRPRETTPSQVYTTLDDITEKRKVEHEYQTLFREMLNGFALHEIICDEQGLPVDYRFLTVNPAFERMTGLKAEDIVGKTVLEVLPGTEPHWIETYGRVALTGEPFFFEKHSQEVGKYFEVMAFQPAFNQFACIFSDITDQKRAGEELKQREKLLSKIFEILPIGIWFADSKGKLLKGNPAGVKIWGAEPHAAIEEYGVFKARRLPSGKEIAPDDWALAHTINEGATVENELLEIDAFDGTKKTILNYTAPVLDDDGSLMGAIVVNNDVTELKKSEKALRENEERLSLSMEASEYGFWDVDLGTGKMYLSPQIYAMNGYEDGELPEKLESIMSLIHPDDIETVMSTVNNSIVDAKPFQVDFRVKRKSGEWTWISAKGKPVEIDENGKPHRLIGTQVNITNRVMAEEAMLYAKVSADYSNRIKDEFLKNVTHELRTPLSAVIGFSDVLLEQESKSLSDLQKDYIRYIYQSGKSLHELVNKMLDLSQYESGSTGELRLQKISIEIAIHEIVSLLLPKATRKSINVSIKMSSGHKDIMADEQKFKEIVYNLLDNAIKFTSDSGSISIEVTDKSDLLQVSIRDTGIGIAKENIDRIFEPFIQIDGSISRRYGGAGLGLPLVKRFVKLHGGNIRVESEPGKGSNFIFGIPLNIEK